MSLSVWIKPPTSYFTSMKVQVQVKCVALTNFHIVTLQSVVLKLKINSNHRPFPIRPVSIPCYMNIPKLACSPLNILWIYLANLFLKSYLQTLFRRIENIFVPPKCKLVHFTYPWNCENYQLLPTKSTSITFNLKLLSAEAHHLVSVFVLLLTRIN